MQEAKGRSEDLIGGGYAKDAFDGLAEANKEIFKDIYPVMRFAESNGAKKLRQCSGSGGRRVPEELLKAAEQIEKGTPEGRAKAADMIADYEQRTVVPEKVYSVERFKNAFAANEYWSGWFFGSWFGAKKPALALSSECGKGTPIPLNGSILNADDRVNYYQKLMAEFKKQDALWKKSIMGQIKAQGQ